MPELPEVETIVRGLRKKIIGKKIVGFWCDHRKIRQKLKGKKQKFLNTKIVAAKRRAKYIVIELDNNSAIVIHLRMTGHLLYRPLDKKKYDKALKDPYNQYVHFKLKFSNKYELAFSDLRKFGTVEIISKNQLKDFFEAKKLGPEPLKKSFSYEVFKKTVVAHCNARQIKQVLLDQTVLAGIGNIYADEILFDAKIKPTRKTHRLKEAELKKLYTSIKKILTKGIKYRGTSTSDFRDVTGEKGRFQDLIRVYRLTGEPCKKCKTKIKRIVVGQRGTHYCSKCQK